MSRVIGSDGCNCLCHRESGVMRVMSCCSPNAAPNLYSKISCGDPNMDRIRKSKRK